MAFIKYQFDCAPELADALLGLLSELPFDSFQEEPGCIQAYLADTYSESEMRTQLDEIQPIIPFQLKVEEMENVNWNAVWESSFKPVQIGTFCGIRASFHPVFDPPVQYEILIDPKMAFGTGHHETTALVIGMMESMDIAGKQVFDYGCGTGILAILAKMMGADQLDAVDIEEAAYENTLENVLNNGVSDITVFQGDISVVPDKAYDLILANINRNVILQSLAELAKRLKPEGQLIISGFLKADVPMMEEAILQNGFQRKRTEENNNWISMELIRN
ncbi:MAG: 50S ribosomal protein L11 methyltransferase [Saprospiraceae bacterium]|nr:50S ribosomal protein L11 methyltransferase [Saprospiraceae bacterium]